MRAGSLRPTGVRWRADTGFEMRCADCARSGDERYWPLDLEFWNPEYGLTRCRACWRRLLAAYKRKERARDPEKYRQRVRRRRMDPEQRRIETLKAKHRWAEIKADPVKLAEVRERNRIANRAYKERKRAEKAA